MLINAIGTHFNFGVLAPESVQYEIDHLSQAGASMEVLIKLVSLLIPITKKVESKFSGCLEITVTGGRKVLNTANANYSYGSLQRVLEFALRRVDLSSAEEVLVLGLGGGSVITSLRKEFDYENVIVAVDVDPVIIEIAGKEFGIKPDYRTEIVLDDAYDYLISDCRIYDLIIVDIFIDNRIPEKFLSKEFWTMVKEKTRENGCVIFNSMGESGAIMEEIKDVLRWQFLISEFDHVEKYNHVLIARAR